jgi:hypothetical protein
MNPGTDPLAALHPLRLPDPVGWWPPAPLWWLLALLALALLALAARALWGRVRRERYRRAALRELAVAAREVRDTDPRAFAARAANILRRAALARYRRAEVAPLCGTAWLEFLDRTAGTGEFSRGAGSVLVAAPYDPAAPLDAAALERVCRLWLRRHR